LRRRKNADFYNANLSVNGLVTPAIATGVSHVFHQYVVRMTKSSAEPGGFYRLSQAKGIGSAVHYPIPLHRQPLFGSRTTYPCSCLDPPCRAVLSLPVHPLLDQKELNYICDTINRVK